MEDLTLEEKMAVIESWENEEENKSPDSYKQQLKKRIDEFSAFINSNEENETEENLTILDEMMSEYYMDENGDYPGVSFDDIKRVLEEMDLI